MVLYGNQDPELRNRSDIKEGEEQSITMARTHLKKKVISTQRAIGILMTSGVFASVLALVGFMIFGEKAWNWLLEEMAFTWAWGVMVVVYVPIIYFTLFCKSYLLAYRRIGKYLGLTTIPSMLILLAIVVLTQ